MQSSLQTLTAKLHKSTDRLLAKSTQKLSETPSRGGVLVKRKEYYGGDPCNAFHALRQFLLNQGIDTRVFTFGSIAIPLSISEPAIADDDGTVDNSFFFEFHKLVSPEFGGDMKVNVLVLLVRCFFEGKQDNSVFHIQLVLNHHRDAIFELNEPYDQLINMAQADGWIEPSADAPMSRITFFEKKYTDIHQFKRFVLGLQKTFNKFEIYGNDLIPVQPIV